MFVADKEGKRISKHDKLRLYEHAPQIGKFVVTSRLPTRPLTVQSWVQLCQSLEEFEVFSTSSLNANSVSRTCVKGEGCRAAPTCCGAVQLGAG